MTRTSPTWWIRAIYLSQKSTMSSISGRRKSPMDARSTPTNLSRSADSRSSNEAVIMTSAQPGLTFERNQPYIHVSSPPLSAPLHL